MTTRTIGKCFILFCMVLCLTGCASKNLLMPDDTSNVAEQSLNSGDSTEAEDAESIDDNGNQTRSIYSWHFEMTNKALNETYLQTLRQLGINRVYQNVSEKVMRDDEIVYLIQKLNSNGIEMIPLMGDKSWVEDGLDEYKSLMK